MRKHIDDIQILRAVASMAVLFFLLVERPSYHFLKTRLLTKKATKLPA
ncbi:MAG: hypothetical protein V7720_12345 [Halioglobus sp.]